MGSTVAASRTLWRPPRRRRTSRPRAGGSRRRVPFRDGRAQLYYFTYLRGKYRLPVLLIVVFLQGGQEGLAMRECVDLAEGIEVCHFRYVAFCLGQNRAEQFLELPQPIAPALAALMKSDWDPVAKKLRCLRAILLPIRVEPSEEEPSEEPSQGRRLTPSPSRCRFRDTASGRIP